MAEIILITIRIRLDFNIINYHNIKIKNYNFN